MENTLSSWLFALFYSAEWDILFSVGPLEQIYLFSDLACLLYISYMALANPKHGSSEHNPLFLTGEKLISGS